MPKTRKSKNSNSMVLTKQMVKTIKKLSIETGDQVRHIQAWNNSSTSFTGAGTQLTFSFPSGIAQGAGENQRQGDYLRIKDLDLRGVLKVANATEDVVWRLFILQHLEKTAPSNLPGANGIAFHMPDFQNAEHKYKVLFDKIYKMPASPYSDGVLGGTKGLNLVKYIKVKIPGKKIHPVRYDAASSTLFDMGNIVAYITNGNGQTNASSIDLRALLRGYSK